MTWNDVKSESTESVALLRLNSEEYLAQLALKKSFIDTLISLLNRSFLGQVA